MGLFNTIRKGIAKMLNINNEDIADTLEVLNLISEKQTNAMHLWRSLYTNDYPRKLDPTTQQPISVKSFPAKIVSELSRLMLLEFEYVEDAQGARAEYIGKQVRAFVDDMKDNNLPVALAVGGMFFKPYVSGDESISIEFVPQDEVLVFAKDGKEITGVIFAEYIERNEKWYTRLEKHEKEGSTIYVSNYAYMSNSETNKLQRSIPLDTLDEWANIQEQSTITNARGTLYGYYKVSAQNIVDLTSPLGASIYGTVVEEIKEADEIYNQIKWEYEAKEVAVHADDDLFKSVVDSKGNVSSRIPEGKERLYRRLAATGGLNSQSMIDVYSPDIRDSAWYNRYNKALLDIENGAALSQGTLSYEPQTGNANYTNELNLKLARNRVENNVHANQEALALAIRELVVAIDMLCDIYNIAPGTLNEEQEFILFGDGIVTDTASRLESMRLDVEAGLVPKWKYIQEKYKLDESTAKEWASEAGTTSDPLSPLFGNE